MAWNEYKLDMSAARQHHPGQYPVHPLTSSQPWPWVKVWERSSSTFSQTHISFEPNIKGLAQTTWEGKVFAVADAVDTDTAETNWIQKVSPDRGDLIIKSGIKILLIQLVK